MLLPGIILLLQLPAGVEASLRHHAFDAHHAIRTGQSPDDGGLAAKLEKDLEKSAARTLNEMSRTDELPRELEHVLQSARDTFLPRWRFKLAGFLKALGTVLFGFTWFGVYFKLFYETDRSESLDRWADELTRKQAVLNQAMGLNPDMVFVFHHPDFDYDDGKQEVSLRSVERILAPTPECQFRRLKELKEHAGRSDRSVSRLVRRSINRMSGGEESPQGVRVTIADVRRALLKDLHEALPEWGFDLTVFSSIDNDELFVCVTLLHKKAVDYFLSRNNVQLQLRQEVVSRLGICQDPDDPACSPPSMPYDTNLVSHLKDQGVLDAADESDLYRTWAGTGKDSVVSSQECIRIIWNEVLGALDPMAATEEGFLVTFYAVHNAARVSQLQATWANWHSLADLTFVQPVPLLKEYFGSRIAFFFAWSGHYSKALLSLVAIAALQEVTLAVCRHVFGIRVLKSRQVVGFSIVLVVWAKIVANLWRREQNFFLELWNLRRYQSIKTVRPQFHGRMVPSAVDGNLTEKRFPAHLAFYRRSLTFCCTVLFCGLVAACICSWMLIFEGQMGLVSSVMLSLQIKVFEAIFNKLVQVMTDYENHQFPDQYHDSLLWKLFLFGFVNNYCAFFCITIRHAWTKESCNGGDCMYVLRWQVSVTLCILCMCSIAQMLVHTLIVRFSLWWEAYQIKKQTGKPMPARYHIEEQAKYAVISEQEEVQNMMTLVIALGFVLLFGGISAMVVPLCFVVFSVQLRAFAVLLITDAQRTFPAESYGIGNWQRCINFLMAVGVLYSGFMFVAFGETFQGTKLLAKMTGMMAFCLFAAVIWWVLDLACPDTDYETTLLVKRRDYVTRTVMKTAGAEKLQEAMRESRANVTGDFREAIRTEAWCEIPQLQAMPHSRRTPTRSLSVHFSLG